MTKYIIYWLTGTSEIVEGTSIANACINAGYGAGAIRAMDWYEVISYKEIS